MRAITVQRFGDAEGITLSEVPTPEPAADQVLIETEAIGVGGVDAVIRRGTLGGYGFIEGYIPGSEVAGRVISVGKSVDPAWIGERVWAFTGTQGGYAEYAVAAVANIVRLPDDLSAVDAVTLGSAAPVARFALARAHFAAGESVLVRGASGSIGIAAVELAARGGASVVAVTTSSPERGLQLREFGATHLLDRSGLDRSGADRSGPGGGPAMFDVIIDIVGGADVPAFIDRLAPNGRLVIVGAVAGMPPSDFGMQLMRSFPQSRSVATFSLDAVPSATLEAGRAELFADAVRGRIHPVVHAVLPLDDAAEAHRQMDLGTVFGRIVLAP